MKNAFARLLVFVAIGLTIAGGKIAIAGDISVSGGTLKDFGGRDTLRADDVFGVNFGLNGFRLYYSDGAAQMCIDMGSNRWVSTVIIQNRNVDTLGQFEASHIYAAADETSVAFSPTNPANYALDIHTIASPAPNVYTANTIRTNTLKRPVYRRYLRYDLLRNHNGGISSGNNAGDAADLTVAGAPVGVSVAAGTVYGMAGTEEILEGAAILLPAHNFLASNSDGDSVIRLLLDLGSQQWIKTLIVTNRTDGASNYNLATLNVKVAPNETQSGFEAHIYTNYTSTIGSGAPAPLVNTAAAGRTLALTQTKCRYLLLELTANQSGEGTLSGIQFGGLAVGGPQGLAVAAGTLYGMEGKDTVGINVTPFIRVAGNGDGDNLIRLLLDLGSRQFLKTLIVTNRMDGATNLSIYDLNVKAAPNEQAPGFDPLISTNYTTTIGSGIPTPEVITAGASRSLSLAGTEARHRYVMLEVTGNFWGNIGPSGNSAGLHFQDISVDTVPPKGSLVCLH